MTFFKKLMACIIAFPALMFMLIFSATAADTDTALDTGDEAPEFSANDAEGELWQSDVHMGNDKYLVVYFYPAAMTGGCTRQACSYRDLSDQLKQENIEVVGISGDSVKALQVFKKAYDLNFTLLSDPDGSIAEKFGVPTSKGGSIKKTIEGIEQVLERGSSASRWTFVIGKDGKLLSKNTSVRPAMDAKDILETIQKHEGKD